MFAQQVIEGAALVVNALPAEQRPGGLLRLFSPVVQPLHGLLAAALQPQSGEQREAILTLVDRLGILFRQGTRVKTKTSIKFTVQEAEPRSCTASCGGSTEIDPLAHGGSVLSSLKQR